MLQELQVVLSTLPLLGLHPPLVPSVSLFPPPPTTANLRRRLCVCPALPVPPAVLTCTWSCLLSLLLTLLKMEKEMEERRSRRNRRSMRMEM
jgi:hypothetical protein